MMLRELHIQHLAVIEDLTLQLGEGLNCFTGQTGAGKSLILGAFELLLGLKPANAQQMLRAGAQDARIAGIFDVRDAEVLEEISSLIDEPLKLGDELLITRKIFRSGRSSVSINGQLATATMVRAIGERLVDIHGQHDHQYLLKPSNQLAILDRFAEATSLRKKVNQCYATLRELVFRRAELENSDELRQQQLDLFTFQANEIDDAQPLEGEYEELKSRHRVLCNLQKIQSDVGNAHAALYESEGAVVERLQMICHVLTALGELDEAIAQPTEQIKSATLAIQEGAYDLGRYLDQLEHDPAEIAEVESRLNVLNRLASKYSTGQTGANPVAEVLAFREEIEAKLKRLEIENKDGAGLSQQIQQAQLAYQKEAKKLTKVRTKAANKIKPLIEKELKMLGMADATITIEFKPIKLSESPEASGKGKSNHIGMIGGAFGLETIEILIRTNPGQPARPLRQIASGGEMSRMMLAIKSILASSDRISVLVFDEIDANIGGRMGTVIGKKLLALSTGKNGRRHQVLCITHLPQIAAFGDKHLRISKDVTAEKGQRQTQTSVVALEGESRIDELAEMLVGTQVTPTTRKQAQEMLAAATC